MSARFDAIYALLVSPFVASVVLLVVLAVVYVARVDRRNRVMRNRRRENELTLAYIADVVQMEQAARAGESA